MVIPAVILLCSDSYLSPLRCSLSFLSYRTVIPFFSDVSYLLQSFAGDHSLSTIWWQQYPSRFFSASNTLHDSSLIVGITYKNGKVAALHDFSLTFRENPSSSDLISESTASSCWQFSLEIVTEPSIFLSTEAKSTSNRLVHSFTENPNRISFYYFLLPSLPKLSLRNFPILLPILFCSFGSHSPAQARRVCFSFLCLN